MALVWFFSRQIALALLPFTVYSVFHVATYTRTNLIPTVQPQPAGPASQSGAESVASPTGKTRQQSPMAESIGRFVKEYYDSSMLLVAILEVALWFRLLLPCLLLSRSAITLWVLYSVFLRTRYSQSTFVQNTFQQLGARIDGFAANQSNPPAVRQTWDTAKAFLHQAVEVTDINKYVGGRPVHSQTGPKKAQ